MLNVQLKAQNAEKEWRQKLEHENNCSYINFRQRAEYV